jgi:e3 binding domain
MAAKPAPKSRSRSSSRSSQNGSRSRNGSKSRNGNTTDERYAGKRPAQQAHLQENDSNREYRRYVQREEEDRVGPPDVLLDVPELRVDSIHFELDDLDAHVAVKANVLNLVKLTVGVDLHLSTVKLDVKGVDAEVVLKARLEHVAAIVDRLMTTLDRNPKLIKGLSQAVGEIGKGAEDAVSETGDAVEEIGQGAQSAVGDVGKGAGQAVGDVGKGAGQAVGDVGQGAGQAVGDVGKGAGQAVGNLDQVVGNLGQTVGQAGQGVGQLGQGALGALGGLTGGGQQASGNGQQQASGNGQQASGNGDTPATGGLAKEVAKLVAREVGHAASDEARDLSIAAARKVRELGQRREQRRAEKYGATEAAVKLADELGLDLEDVEGTGAEGRITVKDVRELQEQ